MLHVIETWNTFCIGHDVRHETRVTALFRDALIDSYVAAGRNWFIALEDPITDPDFGTEIGRNDLRFYPQNHHGQSVFFTLECKRLRVQYNSGIALLTDKYIDEGVRRFVDGRYSSGLPCGGMIGYVMDGDVAAAFAAVRSAIEEKSAELRMVVKEGLRVPSQATPDHSWSADTEHNCEHGRVRIHHVLVAVKEFSKVIA